MADARVNKAQLKRIMQLHFAVTETVLYLDTHPFDDRVLQLHNEYASRLENLMEKYQREYGPLVHSFPAAERSWRWIEEPWPWDIHY